MLLRLSQVGPRDRARVGGKAASLARLWAAGLPVPDAVVVPTDVFRAFLRDNGLWEQACRGGGPGLADAILAGRLDPGFAGELRRVAAELGLRLAVRSSGVDEDREDASFAGQYESVLGVAPGDETEVALRVCWASMYSDRALRYRKRPPPEPAGMAVLVQTLIEPRAAGVMFTVNPMNGSWREMTVEAAWGQGEAVVSGQVVPDYYRVRRPRRTPRPVQRILARVRLEVVEDQVRPQAEQLGLASGAGGGARGRLARRPVPLARREAPKLLHADILRLCRLGLRAEALLGGPQDVEWAIDERARFYVLQSRPVTATADVRPAGPVLWTRRFLGERWTEPATPLGWSLMRDLLDWFVAYPETSRRYLGGEPPLRLHRHAPYVNVTVFRHLAFKLPGAPPPRFMLDLLPPDEERRWLRRHAVAPDLRVYASILRTTFDERRWERFRWNLFTNWRAWDAYEVALDAALAGAPLDSGVVLVGLIASRADAVARAAACRELARSYIKVHICSLLFANIWYQLADGALAGAGLGHLAPDLLRSPAENWTVRTNRALWQLGRGELSNESFLRDFGHRASSSWELFSPRWAEDEGRVDALARTAARGGDPASGAQEETARAEAALADVPTPTRQIVRLARRYLLLRENQRYHFDRLLWTWKQLYLWLERDFDLAVRFLESSEVDGLLDGSLARADAAALADRRGAGWREEVARRARGEEPPEFLVGDAIAAGEDAGVRIAGLGISPGVVTGTVRVLRSVEQADALRPGDILVARATDPGWTPLFLVAGGLIMEQGSLLSHGAVVAREYRLPAVVNVPGATSRLRDGQTVTLDGGRGVVWIR